MRHLALVALLALSACESTPCGPASCPGGCCSGGVCFEGTSVTGGAACPSSTAVVDAGCATLDKACGPPTCCARDPVTQFPLRCSSFCEEACGTYNDPCNASLCCSRGYVCKNERCDSCYGRNVDCSLSFQRDRCCPGFQCLLKPGFSTVFECQ